MYTIPLLLISMESSVRPFAEINASLFSFYADKVRDMVTEELATLQEAGKVRVLER